MPVIECTSPAAGLVDTDPVVTNIVHSHILLGKQHDKHGTTTKHL
jgi:hypothetical protein